ncbi:MAG: SIR2 family protein, partial [Bacteroidota bacterium]
MKKWQEHINFTKFHKKYTDNPEKVVFFVGAGLSMPLFPSWAALLKRVFNELGKLGKITAEEKGSFLKWIEAGTNYLEIADYCIDLLEAPNYRDLLEEFFNKKFEYEEIPPAYRQLLALPQKVVLTTNYDEIPEKGGRGSFSCYTNQNVPEAMRAIAKGEKVVLKIHGDIKNQASIILTKEDYSKIMHKNLAAKNALQTIFSTYT